MVETKVRLILYVQGAKMVSKEESLENPQKNCDINHVTVEFDDKNGRRKRETLTFLTRKQRTISQAINITREAYDYMLDTPTSAKFNRHVKHGNKSQRVWEIMAESERLKKHFDIIAEHMNADSYSFEVLDD